MAESDDDTMRQANSVTDFPGSDPRHFFAIGQASQAWQNCLEDGNPLVPADFVLARLARLEAVAALRIQGIAASEDGLCRAIGDPAALNRDEILLHGAWLGSVKCLATASPWDADFIATLAELMTPGGRKQAPRAFAEEMERIKSIVLKTHGSRRLRELFKAARSFSLPESDEANERAIGNLDLVLLVHDAKDLRSRLLEQRLSLFLAAAALRWGVGDMFECRPPPLPLLHQLQRDVLLDNDPIQLAGTAAAQLTAVIASTEKKLADWLVILQPKRSNGRLLAAARLLSSRPILDAAYLAGSLNVTLKGARYLADELADRNVVVRRKNGCDHQWQMI